MAFIVAVPTLLIVFARAKAALVFVSLCLGSVLSVFVGDTALDMVQTFVRGYSPTTQAIVQFGLLLLPMLLTILFLSRTVRGSKWIINIFPALLTGLMTLYLVVPLLPPGTMYGIYGTTIWEQLTQYQAILVGTAALATLAQLWASGGTLRHKRARRSK